MSLQYGFFTERCCGFLLKGIAPRLVGFQKYLFPEVQETKEMIPFPGGSIEGLERRRFRSFEHIEFEVL